MGDEIFTIFKNIIHSEEWLDIMIVILNNIQQLHEIYSVVYLKVFKSNKSTCDDNSLNGQFVKQ